MKISDFLFKYDSNKLLMDFLKQTIKDQELYVNVEKEDNKYIIKPTGIFLKHFNINKTILELGLDYDILYSDCGCLQFYKTKDCIHIVALYCIGMRCLDKEYYEKEYQAYLDKKTYTWHKNVLNNLSIGLKSVNPYTGLIHLIPCVEYFNNGYNLSLKIGYDKDYVIKDILEFIQLTENNIEYSYGQKLSFIHSYECFDNVSREFYSFIRNIVTEQTTKNVTIRKSHLLKILELYQGSYISYMGKDESKYTIRNIVETHDCEIKLSDSELSISTPHNSSLFVCGVNHFYFIDDEHIYVYTYNSITESRIYSYLYQVNGSLLIDMDSRSFISNVLPIIKNLVTIDTSFYEKYPIPNIKINSYFSYSNGNICLVPKISCKEIDKNSPYLKQLLDGYFQIIEGYFFIKSKNREYIIDTLDTQYKFLTSDLSAIKAFGEVFFDETIKNIKPKKTSKTNISISYNVGLLDFKFENDSLTIEDIQAMLQAYHQKKKFVKLKDNSILELDNQEIKQIDNFLEDFNISISDLSKPVKKPLNYLLKLINGTDSNLSMDNQVIKMIQTIQNFKTSKYEPTEQFKSLLRPYQLEGFKWLKTLSSYEFGGILADDMGLGKTLEIISFIDSDTKQAPSLIVCPMSLVYNWENECNKWKLSCPIHLILGSIDEREEIINSIKQDKKSLCITSYDSLRRDANLYEKYKFRFVIADEAQFIKNQFAQKSEAIKSIQSEMNFALTGTPIENGLADLWSIFDFLMPGYLSSYSHFKSRYESLIIHQDEEALDVLQKRVSPFILRRTKKDVLSDLPDKIEEYYYCKMESKQRDIYDSFVVELKEDIKKGGNNILALLTRLRQICITPELIYQEHFDNTKIDMALELIKSSIDAGHRILVFSQFSQSFPIISRELEQMGIKHFILDGSTKAKVRQEMTEEFNSNSLNKVFLISLKAGGTGLNLVGADMVIHLDPWWNSSAESQATDRAYRIGQTKNVNVIKLICKNTIEEKVLTLQNIKKDLANSIVSSDESRTKLSKNDILELLE